MKCVQIQNNINISHLYSVCKITTNTSFHCEHVAEKLVHITLGLKIVISAKMSGCTALQCELVRAI